MEVPQPPRVNVAFLCTRQWIFLNRGFPEFPIVHHATCTIVSLKNLVNWSYDNKPQEFYVPLRFASPSRTSGAIIYSIEFPNGKINLTAFIGGTMDKIVATHGTPPGKDEILLITERERAPGIVTNRFAASFSDFNWIIFMVSSSAYIFPDKRKCPLEQTDIEVYRIERWLSY